MPGDPIVLLLVLTAIAGLLAVADLFGRALSRLPWVADPPPAREPTDREHFAELAAMHAALDADYDREGRP